MQIGKCGLTERARSLNFKYQESRNAGLLPFEKAFPEIPPVPPLSKGGELIGGSRWKIPLFPPLEKGEER
jgi:hypothetical protein